MHTFATRMDNVPKSFIREILKVTENPDIISFAGGLPNPALFPVQEIAAAAQKVLQNNGHEALQYSTTEGYGPLREYIAQRYARRFGLPVDPAHILITTGSQQGLDLIAKVLLNPGDPVLLERPGYLGAIQTFTLYEPTFHTVPLGDDGPDLAVLEQILRQQRVKLFYAVPNFQNPSGLTYSAAKRQGLARLLRQQQVIFVEDDPYGELRFMGRNLPSMRQFLADNIILLGSFSKVVSPALRLGWVYADPDTLDKLVIAKQAADLHTNYLAQRILYQYLADNDLDAHIQKIRQAYGRQRDLMVSVIEECFPPEVSYSRPEGGMFLWVTLPERMSALDLFDEATRRQVAFVPGQAFYVDGGGHNTLRLNFSNADEARIVEGIQRLAEAIKSQWGQSKVQ